jgi:lysylphosphatidylglycerol synthetase-like protein (DUF2156 family)
MDCACVLAHQLVKRAAEVGLQWVTVGYAPLSDFFFFSLVRLVLASLAVNVSLDSLWVSLVSLCMVG